MTLSRKLMTAAVQMPQRNVMASPSAYAVLGDDVSDDDADENTRTAPQMMLPPAATPDPTAQTAGWDLFY